jgi:hypothetical protein
VTDKNSKKPTAPPPTPADRADENERPTVSPPFDVEAFARAASSPSGQPRAPFEMPTNRPPPPPAFPEFDEEEARTEQITLTNEVELERARAHSATGHTSHGAMHVPSHGPIRTVTASALSIANARSPSSAQVPVSKVYTSSTSATSIENAALASIGGESSQPEITERTIEDPAAEMRERFSLGDYTGALEMSEIILADEPDHAAAIECGANCRTVLENMYAARLGPLDRVPMVVVPRAQMRWLSMDHRAGFVLSLIDGSSSIEMILDVSGMPKLDALRILHELVQQKIVSFR